MPHLWRKMHILGAVTAAWLGAGATTAQSPRIVSESDVMRAMSATKTKAPGRQAQAAANLANARFAAYLRALPKSKDGPKPTQSADASKLGSGARKRPGAVAASGPPLQNFPRPVENLWMPGSFNKLNWGPENLHALPWRAQNVTVGADGAIRLVGNALGEAGIKSGSSWNGGSIEYEVSFPASIPSGTDLASGYLYAANGDELNFPEVLTDGRPRFAIHADGKQVVKILQGVDVRGSRHVFGAAWKAGDFVSFTMDGRVIWTVKASSLPPELSRIPSANMAFISNIAFLPGLPGWAGPYRPLKDREEVSLTLHGFRYTQF